MGDIRARLPGGREERAQRRWKFAPLLVAVLIAGCSWLKTTSGERAGGGSGGIGTGAPNGGGVIAPPGPQVEFVTSPPTATHVYLQLKDPPQPKGRIFVRYEPDSRLPAALTLLLDSGPVVVRDDGTAGDENAKDLLYTGDYEVDVAALVARQQHFDALAAGHPGPLMTPVFDGRAKVGEMPLPRLEIEELLGGARIQFPKDWAFPLMVDREKSLLITDVRVVGDLTRTYAGCSNPSGGKPSGNPSGSWTVGRLMSLLAGGSAQAPAFIDHWLSHWRSATNVDGVSVPTRHNASALTGAWGSPADPARGPFRLLAIVNRFDLAGNVAYGGGSAGEVRLVFGLVDGTCAPLRFTLIFEYGIEVDSCQAFRAWAERWHDLSTYDFANPSDLSSYKADLAALVEEVVNPQPGGIVARLNQARTNEIAFVDINNPRLSHQWEMREFKLNGGRLAQTVLARTPADGQNESRRLWDFITTNASLIRSDDHTVPDDYPSIGAHFLSRATQFIESRSPARGDFWAGPNPAPAADVETRHKFSLNTCDGCHAGETLTHAVHVNPIGTPAPLSEFLTGGGGIVPDPEGAVVNPPRTFADLERRQRELDAIVGGICVQMIHLNKKRLLVNMSG